MRTVIILLSLALFFLTGLIIGMDRSNQENEAYSDVEEVIEETGEASEKQVLIKDQESTDKQLAVPESPEHFTHKAASFLESGVKGFYELIVSVTYQLIQVFF
ncbi:hypothetical protein SAMN04488072_101100 [Lentibacillus halodurans]|uniref:Uncharacterized protein n=1 Tax=Lentibacillus halodurans TaxID=237679 RepID=A0A1I0V196_9BACI|nr:hypothetical protein [Lentibacillus halodurans]SFA70078.1 hypothetical protein SAMN04488072_101100 [Lentibacillus halodurans]